MRRVPVILTVLLALFFIGCGHEHVWTEANCTEQKKCTECGETEGTALGHDMQDATCDNPRICSRCGLTEGKALGHEWEEATCEVPKTCSRCGKTEGEALGHDFDFATTERPKTCKNCGYTEGNPVSVKTYDFSEYYEDYKRGAFNSDLLVFTRRKHQKGETIIDGFNADDGSELFSQTIDTSGYDGAFYVTANNAPFALMIELIMKKGDTTHVEVIGWNGEILLSDTLPINEYDSTTGGSSTNWVYTNDKNIIGIVDKTSTPVCYLDLENAKVLGPNESDVELLGSYDSHKCNQKHNEKYDESKWKRHIWQEAIDGYLVQKEDESWGFVDENDNELKMFRDATEFNDAGYALVSEEEGSYYIIDSELNMVGEIPGDNFNSAGMCGGYLYSVRKNENEYLEVVIQ
ncbi:MAG: hypothetical protein J5518_03100 [Lachnospiraceae bacterium]|nr:hypothetical protein [Lachnospiraceae bacterium]